MNAIPAGYRSHIPSAYVYSSELSFSALRFFITARRTNVKKITPASGSGKKKPKPIPSVRKTSHSLIT